MTKHDWTGGYDHADGDDDAGTDDYDDHEYDDGYGDPSSDCNIITLFLPHTKIVPIPKCSKTSILCQMVSLKASDLWWKQPFSLFIGYNTCSLEKLLPDTQVLSQLNAE